MTWLRSWLMSGSLIKDIEKLCCFGYCLVVITNTFLSWLLSGCHNKYNVVLVTVWLS